MTSEKQKLIDNYNTAANKLHTWKLREHSYSGEVPDFLATKDEVAFYEKHFTPNSLKLRDKLIPYLMSLQQTIPAQIQLSQNASKLRLLDNPRVDLFVPFTYEFPHPADGRLPDIDTKKEWKDMLAATLSDIRKTIKGELAKATTEFEKASKALVRHLDPTGRKARSRARKTQK